MLVISLSNLMTYLGVYPCLKIHVQCSVSCVVRHHCGVDENTRTGSVGSFRQLGEEQPLACPVYQKSDCSLMQETPWQRQKKSWVGTRLHVHMARPAYVIVQQSKLHTNVVPRTI